MLRNDILMGACGGLEVIPEDAMKGCGTQL